MEKRKQVRVLGFEGLGFLCLNSWIRMGNKRYRSVIKRPINFENFKTLFYLKFATS
jgi:hypothetical protein